MTKVTDFDKTIASNIRKLRKDAGFTQPNVADHLGITYQSYQRMERGEVSFRASTLDRLAALYHKQLFHLLAGAELTLPDNLLRANLVLHSMSDEQREEALRELVKIKHGGTQ